MLNVMDLFAGIGGASYAGKLIGNWRTVCYVEWDKYCQQVIRQRIKDGIFDDAPIWDDVQTFDGEPWAGRVDIITGGFPCQPFSVAGKRKGADDERNMWPDTLRIIGEVRPRFAVLENVPALLTAPGGYFGRIIGDLSEIGYDCRWTIVSAADVGAPHLRKRLWILAYPTSERGRREQNGSGNKRHECDSERRSRMGYQSDNGSKIMAWWAIDPADVSDTQSERIQGSGPTGQQISQTYVGEEIPMRNDSRSGKENGEPVTGLGGMVDGLSNWSHIPRTAHGIKDRRDRIKAIGNAWVPATAVEAWFRLTGGWR